MNMKERWALCEQLASNMGMKKSEAFCILSELQDRGLVERIQANEPEAIQIAKELPRYGKTETRFPPPRTAFEAVANDVQLMLWTVKKIGDPERAKAAFNSVMKALGH